jgi:hypothetical protein
VPAFELHAHTTASDGVYAPAALVERARERGLRALAVTDHDTLRGVPEAAARGLALGVEVIAGVEATCEAASKEGGGAPVEVHILGLFVDPGAAGDLERVFERLNARREERMHEMIAKLRALGIDVSFADVVAAQEAAVIEAAAARAAAGKPPKKKRSLTVLARPHLARALVMRGAVGSAQEAFDRWLADGRPACCEKTLLPAADGIAAIRAARGIAALAHPGRYRTEVDLDALAALGLGAIEAFHPAHDETRAALYAAEARRLGLAASGGADFHGDSPRAPDLGGQPMPESILDDLRRAAGR